MSFHEIQFPPQVRYGVTGGPGFSTVITATATGKEQRNQQWSIARRSWNIATGLRDPETFGAVLAFFLARCGRAHGFRFKDWSDFTSRSDFREAVTATDQTLGTGPGPHQLRKTYSDAGGSYIREIAKPVSGTVLVAIDGTPMAAGGATPWSIDTTTGILTFTGTPPGGGAVITAGFEFDVPSRFDTDAFPATYENWQRLNVSNLPIIEIAV